MRTFRLIRQSRCAQFFLGARYNETIWNFFGPPGGARRAGASGLVRRAATSSTEEVQSMTRRWVMADCVRFAAGFVGFLALLRAFSIPIPADGHPRYIYQ